MTEPTMSTLENEAGGVSPRPDKALVVSEIDAWIDKPNGELCIVDPAGGEPTCSFPGAPDPEPFLYSRRRTLGFEAFDTVVGGD